MREIVPVVSHDDTDQVHCGPGPFSMSGADMVSSMMKAAGYAGIAFERFDTDICIGRDLEEAVEFAIALGPAGEIIRLAGAEGERLKPKVVAALRDALVALPARGRNLGAVQHLVHHRPKSRLIGRSGEI